AQAAAVPAAATPAQSARRRVPVRMLMCHSRSGPGEGRLPVVLGNEADGVVTRRGIVRTP
ncbi:hypothetical protein ACE14D_26890, partial [Streptomyces sp. Act-28]